MFAKVLIFAFITSYVTAEIPSYIHICGRRDPNIGQCIMDNVENLKDKICEGMPEFDIPSNNPLRLPNLVVSETKELKIYMKDTEIHGFCDFNITNFYMDMDEYFFNISILFDHLRLTSTYHVHVNILMFDISDKGQVILTTDNINADVYVKMKTKAKEGKRYPYVSNMILNLDVIDFTSEYKSESLSEQIKAILNELLVSYKKELIAIVKPAIEETSTKQVMFLSNSIVKHFTYEELFPDRM